MDLNTYLSNAGEGAAARLAAKIGVSPALISQWRLGVRPIPAKRCPAIELATEGKVTRRDLRPSDWSSIWPELAATDRRKGAKRCSHPQEGQP